jgi:hypothetical protein
MVVRISAPFAPLLCPSTPSSHSQPLPCRHVAHAACLREFLLSNCLGMSLDRPGERGEASVVGKRCPGPESGAGACQAFVPWFELFDRGLFGEHTATVKAAWDRELLHSRLREDRGLQACPGACGLVAQASAPLTTANNVAFCPDCQVNCMATYTCPAMKSFHY